VLRKSNAQYRRDIAQLKREAAQLSKQVAFLQQQERKRASEAGAEVSTEGKRFSQRGLVSHRNKLGLSAADYGKLVGVSAQTVYSWESGRSKPRDQQLAALVAVRNLGKREASERLDLLKG
jgi:DNA-binding transcriptional regulator YiaG